MMRMTDPQVPAGPLVLPKVSAGKETTSSSIEVPCFRCVRSVKDEQAQVPTYQACQLVIDGLVTQDAVVTLNQIEVIVVWMRDELARCV